MKLFTIVTTLLLTSAALGQSTATSPRESTSMVAGDSSAVRIITKVPFQRMDYFIIIVPMDSMYSDGMPVYDPHHVPPGTYYRQDSLQLMLPDSILKLLPTREDFLRPRKP